jgi:hypothetical protein
MGIKFFNLKAEYIHQIFVVDGKWVSFFEPPEFSAFYIYHTVNMFYVFTVNIERAMVRVWTK